MASPTARTPSGVPAELTSFVGRRQEVAAIRQLLGTARLVTLTGFGGLGKTRLAYRVAEDVRRAFPDSVCVVELVSLTDATLLPHTVMDALAIRDSSARDPVEVLCEHLHARRMLLLLDNCEHLIDAAAELADQILRKARGVTILATSRQALRIAGEYVYPVEPLPVPHPNVAIRPGTASQYPAVVLLAERTAAAVSGFELSAETEGDIVRLCQRLEGVPLAIELAAVRLRVLTVDELISRLDDRFALLKDGHRNLPARHQTLQALIDWSYQLCTPSEQILWARASVFAGGFTTDALEAACADQSLPLSDIVDTTLGLLEKSIFVREEHGPRVRFRMLDSIRAYGAARLSESGDAERVEERHLNWCLALFETAGDDWVSPRQQEWVSRILLEHPNLRRALDYCVSEPGHARIGLRLAAMPWFWGGVGYLTEGRLWLDRLLALDKGPSRERVWALATAAYIAIFQGDEAAMATLPEAAHALATELGDPADLAYSTHVLGMRRTVGDNPASAIPLFIEALRLYDVAGVADQYSDSARIELAATYIFIEDIDGASAVVDDLIERFMANGDRWNYSYALWERGYVRLLRGEPDRAETDLLEALAIKRQMNDRLGFAFTLELLAWTAMEFGDGARGATLLGAAEALWESAGTRHLSEQRIRFETRGRRLLTAAAFDAAVERGRAARLDGMLALAMREQPQAATAPADEVPTLTRRQLEVAELVAAGLSNKEIANKLVISLRTAEGHVEGILTKLNFTTRTQIAIWLSQHPART